MQLHRDKQMKDSYQALPRQSPNEAFYWFILSSTVPLTFFLTGKRDRPALRFFNMLLYVCILYMFALYVYTLYSPLQLLPRTLDAAYFRR